MWLMPIPGKVVLMPVMFVMPVPMLVFLKDVLMHVLMALAQVEPDTDCHQSRGQPEACVRKLRPDDK